MISLFQLCVYLFGLYLTTLNIKLKLVGLIIILSHLYKDITKMRQWPVWCDLGGLILSFILLQEGTKLNNNVVVLIGILKFYAHIRQLITNDNKYYIY